MAKNNKIESGNKIRKEKTKMARGICFAVSESLDEIKNGNFNSTDLEPFYMDLGIDGVQEMNTGEQEDDTRALIHTFVDAGFFIDDEDGIPYFSFTDDERCEYFRKRYEDCQKIMSEMTLEEFAGHEMYKMEYALENNYGDCFFDGYYPISVESFIRSAKPDTKYYIGNAVWMH